MNEKAKTIAAVVLLMGGVGIWIPQLLGANEPSKTMNRGTSPALAEPREGADFVDDAPLPGVDPEPASLEPAPRAATPERGLSGTLRAIEQLGARETPDLSALSGLWGESEEVTPEGAAESAPTPQAPAFENPLEKLAAGEEEPPRDPLEAFLEENPLTGLLVGGGPRLASFGSFLAYEGDSLPGGLAVVEAISERRVTLAREGRTVHVSLPPFRSRLSARRSESAEAPDGEQPEDDAPAPDGDATPQPTNGSNDD